ncbi:MAG: ethanolamine ammonia-lyase [Hyphomicrobium sp.]|nr:MAG: ethanolamine ammonia-lyase [Hyphomicrobium sp.]
MSELDPWNGLRRFTDARIGLGRSGSAMPTREVLAFTMAHAQARDAVMTALDWMPIELGIASIGFETMQVASAVSDRGEYLRRPDLGRKLSAHSRQDILQAAAKLDQPPDLVIVVGDGLSSKAVDANIVSMLTALQPHVQKVGWHVAPIVLASDARVALGDEVGELLGAKASLVLIGERPGLSSPDSLGAYLTYRPRVGLKDAERNCISNIRARGLSYDEAAFKMMWLLKEAFRREMTGVELKDESLFQIESGPRPVEIPGQSVP